MGICSIALAYLDRNRLYGVGSGRLPGLQLFTGHDHDRGLYLFAIVSNNGRSFWRRRLRGLRESGSICSTWRSTPPASSYPAYLGPAILDPSDCAPVLAIPVAKKGESS